MDSTGIYQNQKPVFHILTPPLEERVALVERLTY
jgi:hypothetical protein